MPAVIKPARPCGDAWSDAHVGLRIDGWFGDWDRTDFAPSGAEDIVVTTYIH
jgi:hypothetical protein